MDKTGSRGRGKGGLIPRDSGHIWGGAKAGRSQSSSRAGEEDCLVYPDQCNGPRFVEVAGEENGVVPGRVPGGSGTGVGQERCGAVEGRGNGVVPGRVLDGTEGGPRIEEAGRV